MSATGPRWPKTNACVHPARAAISRAVGPQSPPRAAPLPRLPRPPSASAPTSCRADPSRCEPDQTLPFDLRLSNLFELLLKYSTPGAPVGPCGRSLSSDAVRAGQLAGGAIRMIGPGNSGGADDQRPLVGRAAPHAGWSRRCGRRRPGRPPINEPARALGSPSTRTSRSGSF
jgi:hypothetical protein